MSGVPASLKRVEKPITASTGAGGYPRSRVAVFATIALVGLLTDLVTKYFIFLWLGEPSPEGLPGSSQTYWLVSDYFGFQTAVNTGALFGMGKGGSHWFAALSVVAGTGIVYWLFVAGAARDRMLTIALGSVSGGILGNLYDRLGLWASTHAANEYGVRDWILMQIPGHRPWPNYNIADCMLVCGAALLMWHAVFHREEQSESSSGNDEPTE